MKGLMTMELSLSGKVVLITGGGSGIGRASALAFAAEGVKVVIADIDEKGGKQTVSLIQEKGGQAIFQKADVSKSEDAEGMVHTTVKQYGSLDYAFNNAGIEGPDASIIDHSEEEWDQVVRINLKGVWLSMKYEIPQMLNQGKGVIVNNASILGVVGSEGVCAYVAAKHGVVGLTKTAALEYATRGIRVNAVCPGYIQTPLMGRIGATADSKLLLTLMGLHPMKRLGKPEEIASAVVWLCSDAASFITGHNMLVDGGYTIQ
jgi:NAD(P)-dependent dehydrogenase (short-subunit alcohol dehydrogenase family)